MKTRDEIMTAYNDAVKRIEFFERLKNNQELFTDQWFYYKKFTTRKKLRNAQQKRMR